MSSKKSSSSLTTTTSSSSSSPGDRELQGHKNKKKSVTMKIFYVFLGFLDDLETEFSQVSSFSRFCKFYEKSLDCEDRSALHKKVFTKEQLTVINAHVSRLESYLINNEKAIRERDSSELKSLQYSDKVELDIFYFISQAKGESRNIIWKYLFELLLLCSDDEKKREILAGRESSSSGNNNNRSLVVSGNNPLDPNSDAGTDIIDDIMKEIQDADIQLDLEGGNIAGTIMQLVSSGVLTNIMSTMQERMSNNDGLDIRSIRNSLNKVFDKLESSDRK